MFRMSHILSELRVLVAFNESAFCSELGPAGCDDWRGKREDDGNQGGEADSLIQRWLQLQRFVDSISKEA